MRPRLGMTAMILGCLGFVALSRASDDDAAKVKNEIQIVLQISGLGPDGGEIEIKPGHAACKFEPVVRKLQKVPAGTVARTAPIPIVAESEGADRDCSFSITIKEPGKAPRRYVRGVRLAPEIAGEPMPSQTLKCYLSTPSLAAIEAAQTQRK